jgi:hypothetical protein
MKIIITEKQSNFLKRRIGEIDQYVKDALKIVDPSQYNYHDYVEEITQQVKDNYLMRVDFWDRVYLHLDEIMDYVRENYWKEIETHFMKNNLNEQNLSKQDEYRIKWKKFEKFMKRRDDEIKDLISQHTHAYTTDIERYDGDVITSLVIGMVTDDFMVNNDLNVDDDIEFDWVSIYIYDYYRNYIKKELGL